MLVHLRAHGFAEAEMPQSGEEDEEMRRMIMKRYDLMPGMEKYFSSAWRPEFGKNARFLQKEYADGVFVSVLLDSREGWHHTWVTSATTRPIREK